MKLAVLSTLYVLTLVALVALAYRHETALVAALFPVALLLFAVAATQETEDAAVGSNDRTGL